MSESLELSGIDFQNTEKANRLHEQYIRRTFELALRGMGSVSPNPLVGCVIVKEGRIIGEGWHKKYGGPHAEVNAVNSVTDESMIAGADIYVNLEPCSHFGKTPPCADLLIRQKAARVIICNTDPHPLVSGKGIAKLLNAGIEVITCVLENEGLKLNRRFFTGVQENRPYIILKWAQSADGFMGKPGEQIWLSNAFAKQLVHKWRSEEDAILIGANTAITDNPSLTVREWTGRNPVRVVLSGRTPLPPDAALFNSNAETIFFNADEPGSGQNLNTVLRELKAKGIQSVIVEGGQKVLISFIDSGLWDEARIFVAPAKFKTGIRAPSMHLPLNHTFDAEDNKLYIIENQRLAI
ncbi:MAG: bifunctional diaminohydroxyphosphoribosylaminopyrimidine deaminase/5-amino-6-(5-phosphoribosylamino)uracil reductase RibD [Bacteroidota bacterium]